MNHTHTLTHTHVLCHSTVLGQKLADPLMTLMTRTLSPRLSYAPISRFQYEPDARRRKKKIKQNCRLQMETFTCGLTKEGRRRKKHTHPVLQKHFWCVPCVFPGHSCISGPVENTDSETILETMPAGASLKLSTRAGRPVRPAVECCSLH